MRLVLPVCAVVCTLAAGPQWATAQPGAPEPLTEAEALARMMLADPRVPAVRARIEEVRAEHADRTWWSNPSGTFSREHAGDTGDLFLMARQEVPLSPRRGHLRAAGTLAVDAAGADATFRLRELHAALRRSFAALLVAQEREVVLRQSVEDLARLIEVLRLREDAGEGSRYDRLRGERALVDLENELAATAIARARARVALAALVGPSVDPGSLVVTGSLDQEPPSSVEALIDRALAARPDSLAADLTLQQHDAERRAAAALRVPVPTLGFGLKRTGLGTVVHNGTLFSVDLAVPLFNRGQSAVARADARAVQADAARTLLRRQIEADVRAAHLTLTMEQVRAARYRQSVADATDPLASIARVAYDEGELGILELLDADRQRLEARLRVLDLTAAARFAAIELDRVTGIEVTP
jgi:outer membrane protein, heavy metal efflux system